MSKDRELVAEYIGFRAESIKAEMVTDYLRETLDSETDEAVFEEKQKKQAVVMAYIDWKIARYKRALLDEYDTASGRGDTIFP